MSLLLIRFDEEYLALIVVSVQSTLRTPPRRSRLCESRYLILVSDVLTISYSGGIKASGFGKEAGIGAGIDEYLITKTGAITLI